MKKTLLAVVFVMGFATLNNSAMANEFNEEENEIVYLEYPDIYMNSDAFSCEPQSAKKHSLSTCPYTTGLADRFLGIRFGIEGEFGPSLRVIFNEDGYDINPYFDLSTVAYMRKDGVNTIEASVVEAAIHWADKASATYRTSNIPAINAISFQIPTTASAETPYQFCLTNIELVFASEEEAGAKVYIPLMPNADGWVGKDDNELGLQGYWYAFSEDGAYSTINMTIDGGTEEAPQSGSVCVNGIAARVVDVNEDGTVDYDLVWGAGFGFDLCSGK